MLYVSPELAFVFISYTVPESSTSVVSVHVVAAPPTVLLNTPSTRSVVPDCWVKLLAADIVKFRVAVALLAIVHPPDALPNTTL